MNVGRPKPKTFPVHGEGGTKPPAYDRVAIGLTDQELEDEILGKKGGDGYQAALLREAERRAQRAPLASAGSTRPALDADDWDGAA